MKIHKVNQCCCGCTLETGTKIIAWLEIISGVLGLLLMISSIVLINKIIDKNDKDSLSTNYQSSTPFPDDNDGMSNVQQKLNLENIVIYFVGTLLSIAFGITLLVGVTKRSPYLIKIWIVVTAVQIVLSLINVIVQIIIVMAQGQFIIGLVVLLVALVALLLPYYYIVVVSSFRDEIMMGYNTNILYSPEKNGTSPIFKA